MGRMRGANDGSGRIRYLEMLRAIAIVAVVALHAAITEWHELPPQGARWETLAWINSALRFCVPVFFMISGALLLDPARPLKLRSLWRRRIPRLLVAFASWSLLYAIVEVYGPGGSGDPAELLRRFFTGHFHLWFLLALTGLYMVLPLLRAIVRETTTAWYFVALAGAFTFVFPMLERLPVAGEVISEVLGTVRVELVLGYSVYFVLGYLLSRVELRRAQLGWIAMAGALGLLATGLGTSFVSRAEGGSDEAFFGFLTPGVGLVSVAIFCLARAHWGDAGGAMPRLAAVLAANSLGIYLVHPLVQRLYRELGLTTEFAPPLLSVPVLAVLVLIPSLAVAALLRRIPRAGRYLA